MYGFKQYFENVESKNSFKKIVDDSLKLKSWITSISSGGTKSNNSKEVNLDLFSNRVGEFFQIVKQNGLFEELEKSLAPSGLNSIINVLLASIRSTYAKDDEKRFTRQLGKLKYIIETSEMLARRMFYMGTTRGW